MNIYLVSVLENIHYFFKTLPPITWSGIIEIIILAFLIYKFLFWVGESKAFSLLRGILIILVFVVLSYVLHLDVILEILRQIASVLVIAIVILFKEEIRSAIERLGRHHWFNNIISSPRKTVGDKSTVSEICEATFTMSRVKTGALIVIKRNDNLYSVIKSGIAINGKVTKELLINIFEKNTPLHDGAVIIEENLIKAATCYLPVSKNYEISKSYGTRHRAALGLSEVNDALSIIVSEETGRVSIAEDGRIELINDKNELLKRLQTTIYHVEEDNKSLVDTVKGWFNNDKE